MTLQSEWDTKIVGKIDWIQSLDLRVWEIECLIYSRLSWIAFSYIEWRRMFDYYELDEGPPDYRDYKNGGVPPNSTGTVRMKITGVSKATFKNPDGRSVFIPSRNQF